MSNNVYIGNRYVPVFADPVEWDSLRSYEALTIVTYLGTSYTSKKNVPVGTPLSDTNYWVVTGNYNAQVQELINDVDNLSERIDNINNLAGRNFILLGDSFGNGLYPTNNGYVESSYGWLNYCKTYLTSKGCTVYNNKDVVTVGNAGFMSESRFIDKLNDIKTTYNPNNITDIVVMAGTNDQTYNMADVETAVTAFCNRARELFPNAVVKIGCLGTHINNLRNTRDAYRKGAYAGGAYFINDVFNLMTVKSHISSDGTHLSSSGYEFFANYLLESVIYGHTDYCFNETSNLSVTGDYTVSGTPVIRYDVTKNGTRIYVGENNSSYGEFSITKNGTIGINEIVTFNQSNPVEIPAYYDFICKLNGTFDLTVGSGIINDYSQVALGACYIDDSDHFTAINRAPLGTTNTRLHIWANTLFMPV